MNQDNIHFHCCRCDRVVGTMFITFVEVRKRQEKLEEDLQSSRTELSVVNDSVMKNLKHSDGKMQAEMNVVVTDMKRMQSDLLAAKAEFTNSLFIAKKSFCNINPDLN